MLPDQIVLQSAGSLSVAMLALLMVVLQLILLVRTPRWSLYGWSAAISFSALVYAVGIFIEYNFAAGPINHVAGKLEWTALIFLVQGFYGFTFAILALNGRRLNAISGMFHCILLTLLWFTDKLVSNQFVVRHFFGMPRPFVEADLGPWGVFFILYCVLASTGAAIYWIRHDGPHQRYKWPYLAGVAIWIALGVHDSLAAMGITPFHYRMEYGFLGFAMAILWVVFQRSEDAAAEGKYRMITELANDGILVIQDEWVIFSNPACSAFLERPTDHMSTEDFLELVVAEDREFLIDYYQRLTTSEALPETLTLRMRIGDGPQKVVEFKASMVHYNNKPAVLAVARDVTLRVHEEKALRESEEKIVRLKKMESLGLLAGGVAHDLNNVLSGIVSYPDLLMMELPEESPLRQPIQTMKQSGQRATAIVQDLLTIARGVAVEKRPLSINTAVMNFMLSAEYQKLQKFHPHVTVKIQMDRQLLNIVGSAIHMDKVVMNLVSNAAEAIDGSGEVQVSTMNRYVDRPLKGYADVRAGEYAVLMVKDNGPGITGEETKRIFEPFYTKKVMGRSGTGLGLTVVWNVVQDHDGYIDITSDPGGTCFELYFPATRAAVTNQTDTVDLETIRGQGEAVLVVDDVESQREITCRMLEKLGYTAHAVAGGEAAVEYVKTHAVALLLLDMIMDPGIDGLETYQRIKEIRPDQKAILLSGFAETEQVKKTLALGAARYLKKPILLTALGKAVKETLTGGNGVLPN